MIKISALAGLILSASLLAQASNAQVSLFADDFELQKGPVWSSSSSFQQLVTTTAIKRSGQTSIHIESSSNRSVSRQAFTSVNSGKIRLSWWIYDNGSSQYDLAYFGILSENGEASLSFEIAGNGIVASGVAGVQSDYRSDLGVIATKKWQEMSIDYDFDSSSAVFSFDGAVVHESALQLSDLAEISFRSDDPELYVDDVNLEHTVVQPTSALSNSLNEGFEQGAIVDWTPLVADSVGLEPSSEKSHTGTFSARGVQNSPPLFAVARQLSKFEDGTLTASAWVLNDGSDAQVLASLSLGDSLQLQLIQSEGSFSAQASQLSANIESGQEQTSGQPSSDISQSDAQQWLQLSVAYDFATQTASFSVNGNQFHSLKVPIASISELRIGSSNPQVYVDDIAVTYDPPVRFTQAAAGNGENTISENISLSSTVLSGNTSISWNSVAASEGYRLYFAPQAFSNTSEAQSVDLGQSTTLGAALPFGSNFYVVVAAYANGQDIAFSNMQQLNIPLPNISLTTKMNNKTLQANWDSISDADGYRLYYSATTFSEITNQNFALLGAEQLSLTVDLPFGSNYYIAIAAVKNNTLISNLSDLENVSYGSSNPVFAAPYVNPDWIDSFSMYQKMGGNRSYTDEEATNFFILNGGNSPSTKQVVDRPYTPKVPELQRLNISSDGGKATSTQISANLVTLKEGPSRSARQGGDDYIVQTDYTSFRHRDFWNVNYFSGAVKSDKTSMLGLAFDIDFGMEDIGNYVKFYLYMVNDVEKIFTGKSYRDIDTDLRWGELNDGSLRALAQGIATVGTHEAKVVDLTNFEERSDTGMGGEFGIVLRYESTGLDGITHEYLSEPIIYSLQGEFQKLDTNGNAISDNSTEWACFRDNTSGLIWEAKTNDSGLHDAKHTYSLYSSDPLISQSLATAFQDDDGTWRGNNPNGGVCSDSTNCDTEKFVAQVNAAGLCGAKDWRLPTLNELNNSLNVKTAVRAPFYAHRYLNIADSTWTSTRTTSGYAFYQRLYGWWDNFRKTAQGTPAPLETLTSSPLKVILVRKP